MIYQPDSNTMVPTGMGSGFLDCDFLPPGLAALGSAGTLPSPGRTSGCEIFVQCGALPIHTIHKSHVPHQCAQSASTSPSGREGGSGRIFVVELGSNRSQEQQGLSPCRIDLAPPHRLVWKSSQSKPIDRANMSITAYIKHIIVDIPTCCGNPSCAVFSSDADVPRPLCSSLKLVMWLSNSLYSCHTLLYKHTICGLSELTQNEAISVYDLPRIIQYLLLFFFIEILGFIIQKLEFPCSFVQLFIQLQQRFF